MRVALPLGGTDGGRSGIGTYVREVLPRLARRLAEGGGELVAFGTPKEIEAYATVLNGSPTVPISAWFDRPEASALWYLLRVAPRARGAKADVLLLPAANRRCSATPKVPTVAVVHDLAQLHVPDKYDPARMFYFRHVLVPTLRLAKAIVAVSGATRHDLVSALGEHVPPVHVVPNGVDWQRFASATEPGPVAAACAHLGLERPYVLYPARLEHPGKNHLRLLRAFARSPVRDTHVMALAGKDCGAEKLIVEEIDRLGLGDRARLLGFVPDAVLPGLVAGADAVAMAGLHEGFGLPALEALAAGRPVCAAQTGALPEVVGELAALCDPSSEASIRNALERALYDEALRTRCAREGPIRAESRSWDRTVEGLLWACEQTAGVVRSPA